LHLQQKKPICTAKSLEKDKKKSTHTHTHQFANPESKRGQVIQLKMNQQEQKANETSGSTKREEKKSSIFDKKTQTRHECS